VRFIHISKNNIILSMLNLNEKYILNKQQKKVAVQLDLKTFKKIEDVLEDYALGQYIEASMQEDKMTLEEAKSAYKKIKKS
jgi:RelB Antitoxin alpha helical domain